MPLPVLSFLPIPPRPMSRVPCNIQSSTSVRKGHWRSSAVMLDAPFEIWTQNTGQRLGGEFCIRGVSGQRRYLLKTRGRGNVTERRGRKKCKQHHGRSTCWEIRREAGCWGKWWSLEQWMLRNERISRTASQQDFCRHLLHLDYVCPARSSVDGEIIEETECWIGRWKIIADTDVSQTQC